MPNENDQNASPEMARLKELEAKLEIYKSTLTEIYEQYDQKLEELSLVRRMGDALRSTHSLEAMSRALLETVAHEVSVDRLTLMLTQEKKGQDKIYIRAAYWADQEIFSFFEPTHSVPWSAQFLGPFLPEGDLNSPIFIAEADARYDPLGKPDDGNRTLIFLPLLARHNLLGLLVLSRPHTSPFTPEDERMLAIMSDQAGSYLSSVLLFDDLTRVNQRLTDSESRARQVSGYLQNLLETANDAMITLNQEGRITYANRKAAQWGWTREELVGREFRALLDETSLPPAWKPGSPPLPDEVFETVLINAAGERREVILSTSMVEGDEKNQQAGGGGRLQSSYSSWMVLASDVTERRYLERQLIHSEKLASIGLLAAGVAHEVGNPLSAVSGYAQILADGVESEAERKEYLTAIINQSGRIQKILRELLDYSRPSKGLVELLDLGEMLPRTMHMVESQRVFRGVDVSFDLDDQNRPHLVSMDPDHLAQIVIIIAMNAAQAMNGEGSFKISLSKPQRGDAPPQFNSNLNIAAGKGADSPPAAKTGWVAMSFTDNGPGIDPKNADRLFDPFFTTKQPGEGTGLGLSICQRLVDSYEGRIDLKSAPGQGATFIITLPETTV